MIKIKYNEDKNIVNINVSGKSIDVNPKQFRSDEFTEFLIKNGNDILTNEEPIVIDEKDHELVKFFKRLFKDIEKDELQL